MLGPIRPTPYDLYFSVFGIPVRVNPWFWAAGTVLGWGSIQLGNHFLLIWLACIFVSILIHELGHAFAAEYFGSPAEITLYHFGGLASFRPGRGWTYGRSIIVSLSGPGAGFLLYGLLRAFSQTYYKDGYPNMEVAFTFQQLEYINLFWGLLNLVPVLPLDGGQIARDACYLLKLRNPMEMAIKISMFASGLAAYFFFSKGMTFAAVMFGFFCYNSYQSLHQGGRRY